MPAPGEKRARRRVAAGRIGTTRHAWADTSSAHAAVYLPEPKDEEPQHELDREEPGQEVVLHLGNKRSKAMINLTALTHTELASIAHIVTIAVALAEPTCVLRDENAMEAAQHGDYSFSRIYRSVPRIFVREGHESSDGSVIHSRLASLLELARQFVSDPGNFYEQRGRSFLKRDEAERRTQNYVAQADEPQELRSLDG